MLFPGAASKVPPGIFYQSSFCISNNSLHEQDTGFARVNGKGYDLFTWNPCCLGKVGLNDGRGVAG